MNKAIDFSVFAEELSSFSGTGYFMANLCDNTSYANDAWYECMGADKGLTMHEVFTRFPYVHPVDHYSINTFLENAKKGYEKKYKGYMRVKIPGRDVSWRWYQVDMMITEYAPSKGVVKLTGMQNDVTALMGGNEESLNVMSYLADLLQVFNTLPWTLDFRTKVVVTNRSFVKNEYGFSNLSHQMSFDEWLISVLPQYQEDVINLYEQVHQGIVPRGSIDLQMRMGEKLEPVWVDCSIIAQEYDDSGQAVTAIGAMTIIQERKMAEYAMKEAKLKAEHANNVKTNFLSSMSHEFRTPLNSILGFSTIMAHSEGIEERMQSLGAIQSSGAQLLQIIDDVIEFSQIEADEVVLKQSRVEMNALVERAVAESRRNCKPGVEIYYFSGRDSILVRGDEAKIFLVAKHLVGNAVKYTEKGRIDVSIDRNNEFATVIVKDTGRGMTKESLTHIFDRFYKGSEYIPGTGLGLSIVKHLVDMWKGKIEVKSEQDKGTTFSFTIPLYSNLY